MLVQQYQSRCWCSSVKHARSRLHGTPPVSQRIISLNNNFRLVFTRNFFTRTPWTSVYWPPTSFLWIFYYPTCRTLEKLFQFHSVFEAFLNFSVFIKKSNFGGEKVFHNPFLWLIFVEFCSYMFILLFRKDSVEKVDSSTYPYNLLT